MWTVTPRERILAVFRGEKIDKVVWQPRIDHWYDVNKALGTLPERYEGKGLLEIYDDLGASPRTYRFFNDTIRCIQGGEVEVRKRDDENSISTTYVTPKGKLREVRRKTVHGASTYHTEYFIKGVEDLEILAYVLREQQFEFDRQLYSELVRKFGERAEPIVNLPWVPFQRLVIEYMGLEKTILALWKHPGEVEGFIRVMEGNDDERLRVVKESPIRIVNFADNIHHDLCSPPLFQRYILPYYRRRTSELHAAEKFCTSHWDGHIRLLLPFVRETGLDALECVTPKPMGDITLEELHEALQGMILVDGIPANHFLPWVSDQELRAFTLQLLDMFTPRLIAGISDQLSPNGDIEKVRLVGEIINEYTPPRTKTLQHFYSPLGAFTAT